MYNYMTDKITNWYSRVDKKTEQKHNQTYYNHYIEPNSMILLIGGTGCGKTNSLMEFLNRSSGTFYEIIIFSDSTLDEPLYQQLKKNVKEVELYNDIDELPSLSDFDDSDNEKQKLIVFDDFINLKKTEMKKIQEFATAGRKKGFTCFFLAQNYIQVPKNISRNAQYFWIYKINDNVSINNIIRNHNLDDIDKDKIKNAYEFATKNKGDFFMIDLKGKPQIRYRHNFLDFMKLN